MRDSGGGEPQIIRADGRSCDRQMGSELGMNAGGRQIDGEQWEAFEHCFHKG
jgi:hypothetical protein